MSNEQTLAASPAPRAPAEPGLPEGLRRLSEAATPGPWFARGDVSPWIADSPEDGRHKRIVVGKDACYGGAADCAFIAAAERYIRTLAALSTSTPAGAAGDLVDGKQRRDEDGFACEYDSSCAPVSDDYTITWDGGVRWMIVTRSGLISVGRSPDNGTGVYQTTWDALHALATRPASPAPAASPGGEGALSANWLAEEFADAEREVAAWPAGLRASFEKTHGAASPDKSDRATTWDQAISAARQVIYGSDGRGMNGGNRRHLVERVARSLYQSSGSAERFRRAYHQVCGAKIAAEARVSSLEAALAPATRPDPAGREEIADAMRSYLRVCACGGMPSDLREQVQNATEQAARLGYFDAIIAARPVAEGDAGPLEDVRDPDLRDAPWMRLKDNRGVSGPVIEQNDQYISIEHLTTETLTRTPEAFEPCPSPYAARPAPSSTEGGK